MRSLLIVAASMLAATIAHAQTADDGVAGHFQLRLRGVAVLPDASATIKIGGCRHRRQDRRH